MSFPTEKIFDKQIRRSYLNRLFRRVFLEDWLIKAVALLITCGLWLGVTGLRAPVTVRLPNVPLTIRFSNDAEITNSPVQEVNLVVTGDERRIDRINKNDLIVLLNLNDVSTGDRIVQLSPENVNVELPTGVRLEEIQPDKIAVKLETVEEREVSVKAETEGAVAENFEIYSQTVLPQKARVRGPKSFIRSLDSVSTEKINLADAAADFSARQVELNIVNPKVTLLDTVVDVFFKIGEKRVEKLFFVPVKIDGKSGKKAMIVLYGARSVLELIKTENLRVEMIKNDAGENVPRPILPDEFQGKVEIRNVRLS